MALVVSACSAEGESGEGSTVEADAVDESTEADATPDSTDAPDDSDADASVGLPDPCALLSPAEIELATGVPVGEGVADADRQTETKVLCKWTQTGDAGFVAIAVAPGSFVPYGEGETVVGTTVAIDIPGASEAYSVLDSGSVGMRVDGDYIVLAFVGASDLAGTDVTIALATLVASRYGG